MVSLWLFYLKNKNLALLGMVKFLLLLTFLPLSVLAQQPYYDDVDLTKSGAALKQELATKITETHTNFLTYTPGIWEADKITDVDPENPDEVLLLYGYEDQTDQDATNDRTRDNNRNGGNNGDWNREHTYAKSLGTPNLGTEGPGSDAHHLRPSDVQRNANRGNRKFAAGTGNSGTVGTNWYPGDEWKAMLPECSCICICATAPAAYPQMLPWELPILQILIWSIYC